MNEQKRSPRTSSVPLKAWFVAVVVVVVAEVVVDSSVGYVGSSNFGSLQPAPDRSTVAMTARRAVDQLELNREEGIGCKRHQADVVLHNLHLRRW